MTGGKVYGSSNMTVLLQSKRLPCSPDVFDAVWVPSSDPSLQGSTSIVNFDAVDVKDTADERHFLRPLDKDENGGDDDCDMYFHPSVKKRRLTTDQVRFLEKSFEVENKLEPERKIQLANELGLLPRQVAIWFQNRRARFKTKQLEKDYCSLKACYEKLKLDHDNLVKENGNLKNEVDFLKSRLLIEEKGKETGKWSVDLESPADSCPAFGPDHSDFSQDEDDNLNLSKSLLPFHFLPKAEDACSDDRTDNSYQFGFPVEDQTFHFWP